MKTSKSAGGGGAYQAAAGLLNNVWSTHQSLKTLVYDRETGQLTCSKATYALCTKVLAAETVLRAVLAQFPTLTAAVRNTGLLYAAVYELVAGQHLTIRGGGAVKRHVMRYQDALQEAWNKAQTTTQQGEAAILDRSDSSTDNNKDNGNNEPLDFPRYLRVNTLRTCKADVVKFLRHDLQLEHVQNDEHIPDLLVLPRESTPLILQQSSQRYNWVLQDKSSCFSAYCLVHGFDDSNNAKEERVYLDACAAPGNKTTHLAALVASKATIKDNTRTPVQIHALDRSPSRFDSLRNRVQQHVPNHKETTLVQVHTSCRDFLSTSSSDETYTNVTDILLDPSCSGSGIFSRQGNHHNQLPPDRLTALAQFQKTALIHALTQFENVRRVVYSTCSLHNAENEEVVAAVLAETNEHWRLVAPACLAKWHRRGHVTAGLTPVQAAALIRVDRPDRTNGFFVACWERIGSAPIRIHRTRGTIDSSVRSVPAPKIATPDEQLKVISDESHRSKASQSSKRKKTAALEPSKEGSKREPAWVKQSGKKKRRKR